MPWHWPEHDKKQGISEAQTLAIMTSLVGKLEPALRASLKEANMLFDKEVGEAITEDTLTCLRKIVHFLKR
ncbi:hypothetical protein JC525_14650 [Alteromonas sp. IB21]|uniref:hypothetical protein n=1 Tax=Alteromonas sp. IB21 TaxID=2779369 RepID=UPI0018E8CFB4|nr:hypothetical protein [Alteromonas sp. IB21]MBJ2130174.1 hypothetical protein [Alteromonas sp. IB21]